MSTTISANHMEAPLLECSINTVTASVVHPDINSQCVVQSKLEFLDKWLKWLICIKIAPPHKHRSKCFGIAYILFNIIATILLLIFIGLIAFLDVIPDILNSNYGWVYSVSWAGYLILFPIIKLLSMWYYHKYFNYPWYIENNNNYNYNINYDQYNKNMSHTAKYYKSIIYIFIFIKLIIPCIDIYATSKKKHGDLVLNISEIVCKEIFYYIPIFFIFIIESTICYKYHWYLLVINKNLDNMDLDLTKLYRQYIDIYKEWKRDYVKYLKWILQLVIISIVITIWAGIYHFVTDNMFDIIRDLFFILLYFISASLLNDTFDEFQNKLWIKMNECIGNDDKSKLETRLSTFIAYTTKYPLQIELAGITVSRRNIVVFVVAFIAARYDAPIPNNYIQND